eukprot:4515372-Prymnesium_polylepis.1
MRGADARAERAKQAMQQHGEVATDAAEVATDRWFAASDAYDTISATARAAGAAATAAATAAAEARAAAEAGRRMDTWILSDTQEKA